MKKSGIVIYGAGLMAEKFLYRYHGDYSEIGELCGCKGKIEFVIDNNGSENFNGFQVYPLSEVSNIEKYFIIVATQTRTYLEIRDELRRRGLKEIQDFRWYGAIGKKICYIHANCLGRWVKRYLDSKKSFVDMYSIYPSYEICDYDKDNGIDDSLLRSVDIFIYQRVKRDNSYNEEISDERCITKLKKDCHAICIPNLFPLGYGFYQSQTRQVLFFGGVHMFYVDEWIDERMKLNDAEKIYHSIAQIRPDKDKVYHKFQTMVQELKSRELTWDIKVSSYFLDNYKKEPMFYDIGHPSAGLGKYVLHRIAACLNIECENGDCDFLNSFPIGANGVLWSQISEILGLEYDTPIYRNSSQNLRINNFENYGMEYMDEIEYIRQYLFLRCNTLNV